MKVLDYSPIPFETGKISIQDRLQGIMKFGFSWVSEMKSQEVVQNTLGRLLDNSYTFIKNLTLPEAEVQIPLILVGPHGLSVLYNSSIRGVYRAKEDDWSAIDNRSRSFKPAKPNLVMRTKLMSRAVESHLVDAGYNVDIESVLVFTNPGVHVDSHRPSVRVLLFDALEQFGARLGQSRPVLAPEDTRAIINALTVQPKTEDELSSSSEPRASVAEVADTKFSQALQPLQRRMNFSKRQWILLGAFVVVDILVLIGFLFFILLTVQ
jgi:hypothetical protein